MIFYVGDQIQWKGYPRETYKVSKVLSDYLVIEWIDREGNLCRDRINMVNIQTIIDKGTAFFTFRPKQNTLPDNLFTL